MASSENRKARVDGPGLEIGLAKNGTPTDTKHRANNRSLIAAIDTGHSSQVRVHLYRWREQTKIEIKHYTATVPKCFMASGVGVSLDIEKLPELIDALKAVRP